MDESICICESDKSAMRPFAKLLVINIDVNPVSNGGDDKIGADEDKWRCKRHKDISRWHVNALYTPQQLSQPPRWTNE